ncbi:MAG: sulfatase-like hydrolase/transferase [Fibrobacteres bacterium]|nr:sulfatase-like hydrolase/transferase [Fibrobacterota bacterium]
MVQVWIDEITQTVRPGMSQEAWIKGGRRWRETWLSEAGPDTAWTFPDSTRPFWRVPRTESVAPPQDRRNVVLIVMESGRGLNCGFLKPYGAVRDATPFLDSMAQTGKVWARHTCPSMPTVRALMAMHLGVPDHPDKNIATSFPALHHKAFTQILRDEGWQTRFFSGADPAWDNETPWLGRWYDGFDYNQNREQDEDLFAHVGEWMHGNVSTQKPFLVTVMTKSNHYPFDQKAEWQERARSAKAPRAFDALHGFVHRGVRAGIAKRTLVFQDDLRGHRRPRLPAGRARPWQHGLWPVRRIHLGGSARLGRYRPAGPWRGDGTHFALGHRAHHPCLGGSAQAQSFRWA